MRVEVRIVNAFIDGDSGGNPAGVVVNANALTAPQKLEVAAQVGLSETAFVSDSKSATLKLEFFTPCRQIAHCGHATVATFSLLRQLGIVDKGLHSKETIDGIRDILVEADMAFIEQRAPKYTTLAQADDIYHRVLLSIGIRGEQLLGEFTPAVVNTGNSFLIVPLEDEATVKRVEPELALIQAVSEELDLIGYYIFSRQTRRQGRSAGARMFAPRYGIPEEAATGTAAGPLACYLYDLIGVRENSSQIEQGWLMPVPSSSVIQVNLEVDSNRISRLMVGGRAQSVDTLQVDV